MGDLIYVAIVVGFFAICVAYVKACDAIVGPDGDLSPDGSDTTRRPEADGPKPTGQSRRSVSDHEL